MTIAVSGSSGDLGDLGEIGVDLDKAVTGGTHVIDLGQTALSANQRGGVLGVDSTIAVSGNSGVGDSLGNAINVGLLDLLGRGDTQILGDVALVDLGGVGGVSLATTRVLLSPTL